MLKKMKKKIICSSFSNERQSIIDFLYKEKGWDPVFIMGPERMRGWAKEKYNHAVFQEAMQLRNAQFDYTIIGEPVPMDAEIIGALSKYELSCLNMLEDATGWNFSFAERRRYYYDILKYWNTVIHHLKPDIYVYITWPHKIVDYVLYLLCKHYYSIPTIFVDPVPYFDNHYHTVCTSLEDLSFPYKDVYNSGQNCDLQLEIKEYLNSLRSKEAKIPDYVSNVRRRLKKYENFQYKEFVKLILMTMLRGRGFQNAHMPFKYNRHPFESPKSKMNHFQYFWFKDRLRRHNRKLHRIYDDFTEKPDYGRKYLYFASPNQPEATTCPNAGVYEDVRLVLDILSISIPEDWVIYYKEHPGIFFGNLKGSLRRNRHFYEKVASYYNVVMIPAETDIFKLIDSSQAVASIAGTASWEAGVRGKPSLFFGNVWYQGCKSLFRINTLQDCRDAIKKIVNGYTPDQKDIERYASAIQQASVKDMIHRNFYERIKKCPDPKYEMERIAKAIYRAYEVNYL